MADAEVAAAVALCAISFYRYLNTYHKHKTKVAKKWRKRRWWMITIHRNRTQDILAHQLAELVAEPSGQFKKFTRMSVIDFNYLLEKVTPMIAKQNTRFRESIPAKTRLAITLRFLASGDSYESLHFLFKVSAQLISQIVPEVCAALNQVLQMQIKLPSTSEEWQKIAKGFKFPRCIGAIDGKHINIICPKQSGSEYYNYKNSFSIVLLALVDSDYKFLFADIGSQGRISDGGVFRNSFLWQKICSEELNFPPAASLPGLTKKVPYVFLADGAFALDTHIMKPYPGDHNPGTPKRVFNNTLSSSRVVVENTFGILASKFRIFRKPLLLDPEKTSLVTMTCILLHNFLRNSVNSRRLYNPAGTIDIYDDTGKMIQAGSWRKEVEFQNTITIQSLRQIPRRSPLNAKQIREEFSTYFSRQK